MADKKLKCHNGVNKIKLKKNSEFVKKSKKIEESKLKCNYKVKNKSTEEELDIQRCINNVVIKPIVEIKATVEGLETSMV